MSRFRVWMHDEEEARDVCDVHCPLREAAAFNERAPVGTPVRYWTGLREGAGRVGTVRSPAQVVSDHASCWIEGCCGSVSLSHVRILGDVVERPILFNDEMVRAILAGRKTQTRRPCKDESKPLCEVGDLLWVRECVGRTVTGSFSYRATTTDPNALKWLRWTPSIHMPRWASRITLRVTSVATGIPDEIDETDAVAEGFEPKEDSMLVGLASRHFVNVYASIYGDASVFEPCWVIGFEVAL